MMPWITTLCAEIPNTLKEYCLAFVSALLIEDLTLTCECYCNTPKWILVLLPIMKKTQP